LDIGAWLRRLGLQQYEPVFRENAVDVETLPELTEADLEKLGILLGHRKRILRAIDTLQSATVTGPARPDRPAQRRQLTILFCDLVGSTTLAARLDPEDLTALLALYHRTVSEVAEKFGGFIAKYMGDGVLVYFGYPQAHEDDAERAIRCGLELVGRVRQLDRASSGLDARIGIATGLVVVGELVGTGDAQEHGVVGKTPNLAARLQGEASPGGIVVSEATRRLAGDWFAYHDLGSRVLKGIDEPVPIIEVTGELPAESRFAAIRAAHLTPFVGRDHEIALLLDRWRLSVEGEGQVVVLSGEAGIGKSRIAEQLRERIGAGDCLRIRYQCSPYHTDSALHPTIVQLRAATGIIPTEPSSLSLERLERLLRPGSGAEALPLFAALLGILSDGRYEPLDLSPELQKVRTLRALAEQLFLAAAAQPVLFLVEDAHWIDPTTHELLDAVIEPIGRARVLLVVTARPEFQHPWSPHAHVATLALTRLGQRDCTEMIARMTSDSELPQAITRAIVANADGVPLFVEELTKSVLESGLRRSYGPLPPLAVPATLQDSLMARLDRLSTARDIAQIGAAIGREFDYALLAEVAATPEAALLEALSRLEEAGLIFRRGTPPESSYTFKHALVQDAAYSSLLRSRRQQLHALIANVLERIRPGLIARQPEVLARHLTEAGLAEPAARQWLRAGQQAMSRSAAVEAAAQLARGIAALEGVAADPERDALELDLQIAVAAANGAAHSYSAAATEAAFLRALELLRARPDDPREFPVRRGLAAGYAVQGEMARSEAVAIAALERAQTSGDSDAMCFVFLMLAFVHLMMGRFAEAEQETLDAEKHYNAQADRVAAAHTGLDSGGNIALRLMLLHAFRSDRPGADKFTQRALNLAEQLGHTGNLCNLLSWVALRYLVERDLQQALSVTDRMAALADEYGMAYYSMLSRVIKGAGLAVTEPAQAAELIEQNRPRLESFRAHYLYPTLLCFLAEAQIRLGRADQATTALDQAIARAERSGVRWWDPELHRVRALLARQAGDSATAREELLRAIATAEVQGSEAMRRRAISDLAGVP
jgi:class 3 adenylate cyclase/tetratricopeptide (TPR) repeat protein